MLSRRRGIFAALVLLVAFTVSAGMLLAADLYVHHRAERSAGLNRWGYRGRVVGRKRSGERRLAMLGGSTVFGYGVFADQSLPALLERDLQQAEPARSTSVVNLGFNNEGAFALEPTLEDFDYLDLDVAILYAGYNDRLGDESPNTALYRHESPVFRMFGYFPILPLVLKEKAIALRTGGQLAAAQNASLIGGPKPVFSPNLAERTSARAMEAASAISDAMSAQVNRIGAAPAPVPIEQGRCSRPWATYCDSMHRAITYARRRHIKVLMVLPPLMTRDSRARHQDQQSASMAMVRRDFADDAAVAAVDLSGAIDLMDRHYSPDELHLDQDGNAVIARALVAPIRALIGAARP